jgi:hypothetical protein
VFRARALTGVQRREDIYALNLPGRIDCLELIGIDLSNQNPF